MLGINYFNPIQTGQFFASYDLGGWGGGGGESSFKTDSSFQMT